MISHTNHQLHWEGLNLNELAQQYGTPLYVYSQNALTRAFQAYETAFSALKPLICYAVKANGNLHVLHHFATLGSGFDVVSGGELARVLAAGGAAEKTIFSGVGKSEAEIAYALNAGILCFNVESLPEIDRIQSVAESLHCIAPISLRINPDVDAKTHPYISTGLKGNKFGIAFADALTAYQYAKAQPNLQIMGIDCHIGSQLTEFSPLIEACHRLIDLVDALAAEDIHLKHMDLGGGVGIRYQDEEIADLSTYADAIQAAFNGRNLALMLEPGRSLVGNAGLLLTQVEYVKRGEEKNFVIVDAAMNDLMRPTLYQAYHHIEPITQKSLSPIVADVVGPVCESSDFLGLNRSLAVESGDILAVHSAGAYAASMASQYNARPRAAEVMLNQGQARLIRQREKWADLWALETEAVLKSEEN